jgi:hypothetical protein
MKRNLGYEDQYMRNTVQLNQGFAPDGAPRFSEIGNLTGMAATDWSWAVLFADLDNDGWKDVYITNGYRKDVTNLDFINYSAYNQIFGSVAAKTQKAVSDLDEIAEVEVSNYLFHNKGGLEFENVSKEWGVQHPSFTNGAVYTDLDNDGDLDLVTNNIDAEAFVFENRTRDRKEPAAGNYLQVRLVEQEKGLTAYNSKVLVYAGGQTQYQEYSPFLGYKSTVDDVLHFGLGALSAIDSLVIYWPDGRKNKYEGLTANQRFVAGYEDQGGLPGRFKPGMAAGKPHFLPANQSLGIDFRHADNEYTDLKTTRTLIRDYSKTGPALTTGDINGDGLEDFFVGGNNGQAGTFYVQGADGRFVAQPMLQDSAFQDVDALLFDADQDGDNDLYVVSGGTFAPPHATDYQDRLYINDGNGNFAPAADALPEMRTSGSCVRAADYDGDGDPDLFVGGRILPGQYPLPARSYLLRNDGGIFTDLTPDHLKEAGLVTDAVWADLNGDGEVDLTVVGEWMPLTFFANNQGELRAFNPQMSGWEAPTNGWWMHVNAGDLDGDGDMDLLVGNLGLNTKLRASADQPVKLYAKDFDSNGAIDPLLSCFIEGKEYLMHERDLLIDQIPGVKRRFPDYKTYAEADVAGTLSVQDLENATIESSYLFASIILRNDGNGRFHLQELPAGSQLSPVNGSLFFDLDQDGNTDILTVGNLHATETTQIGWHDASYGTLLLQNGNSLEFRPGNALAAGLQADGDVRTLKSLTLSDGQRVLLIGVYGGSLQAVSLL